MQFLVLGHELGPETTQIPIQHLYLLYFLPRLFFSSNFFSIFLLFSNSTFFLDSFDNTLQTHPLCCPLSLRWETNLKLKKTWKCICIFGEMGYKFQLPSDPERVSGPERFMNCRVETFIYPTSYRGPCLFFSIIVYFILTLTQTVEANRNLRPDFMTYF